MDSKQKNRQTLSIDISNINLTNLKRISNQLDINNIPCDIDSSPIFNIDASHKIVAIGDIHGDLTSLLVILFGAQLINNNLEWIGGNTFVVFTGDILDNYRNKYFINTMKQHPADEITIISFLADLNQQAIKTEGRVLLCLGNHELLNLMNQFRYVSEPTREYFRGFLSSRKDQFRDNSILRQKLSCLFQPFILINNKYFFCHAGITSEFIHDLNTHYSDKISLSEKLIDFSKDIKNIILGVINKSNEWILINHINNDDNSSLFWTRHYGVENRGCDIFTEAAKLLGIKDLILIKGHDAQDDYLIKESCNKNIYLIDTQISRSFLDNNKNNQEKLISDNMNYIEIKNDTFSIISVKLTQPEIIYKEKIEQFIYKDSITKKISDKVKNKTGMLISGVKSSLTNLIPENPFKRKSSQSYEVEHEDGTTYYDENDVPHDEYGRVLFGGYKIQ